jgi:glucan phosphoethanolaminetransferase (alkaline phosphatase superfamily)
MPSTARLRLGALSVLCALPYVAMLIFCARHHSHPRSVLALLASAALVSLLLAGLTRTWRLFFLAYLPLLVIASTYCAYALAFGIVPGHTLGILLLSATAEEIRGLVTVWPQKWLLLPGLALLCAYVWLAWGLPAWPIFAGRVQLGARVVLVLAFLATAAAASNAAQLIDGLAFNPVVGSFMFGVGELPRARAEMRGANIIKVPFHASRAVSAEEVHVLIVGESERRGSWSLYGYSRETTPYLERIRGETIVLGHVVADANLTNLAVPMILTGIPPEDLATTRQRGNLLDVAKEAGYSTTWLVNQDINVSNSIGITPDYLDYPPEIHEGLFGRHLLDEALLPAFRRALARSGSPRFIGMHIMESHWEYYLRYPAAFRRYGHDEQLSSVALMWGAKKSVGQAIVDSYDNSVLHSDWFLEQVIEAVRALKVPATVTLIPDHGESLEGLGDGDGGHGGPVYNDAQFQIPAFVWVNDAYRAAHPERVAALASHAGDEIHSHDFFCAVADLMGISWPGFRPENSFASAQFIADTRRQVLVGGVLQVRPQTSAAATEAHSY